MDLSTILILVGIIAVIVIFAKTSKKAFLEAQNKKDQELQEFRDKVGGFLTEFEQNGITPIESDIKLNNGENLCTVLKSVDWQEYRKVRSGYVAGHGLVKRIKIAKGLTYRIGAGRIGSLSSDEIKTIDSGDLYVTDKRMIFRGGQGNKNLPFGKIIAINLTMTGFEIERETGKNVYIPFNFKASPDKLAIIQFCNEVSE